MKLKKVAKLFIAIATLQLTACNGGGNDDENLDLELIPVTMGEKSGYIDQNGKYVINPQFAYADNFYDGLARVKTTDAKIGYIDKKGKFVIPAIYEYGTIFKDGLAIVVKDSSTPICIDTKGNEIFQTPSNVLFLDQFSDDGIAKVKVEGEKYGFLDKKGQFAVNPQFEAAEGTSSEGLAAVKSGDKWGFVDTEGNIVINPQFDNVSIFQNDLALVKQGDKWGYINKKGEYVVNPQFDDAQSFSTNGLAKIELGQQWGFINTNGEYVINPQFNWASKFYNGLCVVQQGKLYGAINTKGEYAINPQFDYLDDKFSKNGLVVMKQNGSVGYSDSEGKIVINPQFDAASQFYNNIAFVKSNQKWGIINEEGKYIVNPQFDLINNNYYNKVYGMSLKKEMDNRVYSTKFKETQILDYILDRNKWLNDTYNNTIGQTAETGKFDGETYMENGVYVSSPIKDENIELRFVYQFDENLYYGESFNAKMLFYGVGIKLFKSTPTNTDTERAKKYTKHFISEIENNENVKFEKIDNNSWFADKESICFILTKNEDFPFTLTLWVTKNKRIMQEFRKDANKFIK